MLIVPIKKLFQIKPVIYIIYIRNNNNYYDILTIVPSPFFKLSNNSGNSNLTHYLFYKSRWFLFHSLCLGNDISFKSAAKLLVGLVSLSWPNYRIYNYYTTADFFVILLQYDFNSHTLIHKYLPGTNKYTL